MELSGSQYDVLANNQAESMSKALIGSFAASAKANEYKGQTLQQENKSTMLNQMRMAREQETALVQKIN